MQIPILHVTAGLVLLFLGRRLFWLFVGLLGFLAGITFGAQVFSNQPYWLLWIIAIGCGLVGIFLAFFLQRLAIGIAGFLAGGFCVATVVQAMGWSLDPIFSYLIGGVLGAILLSMVFDWALIFFSSVTGALLVTKSIPIQPSILWLVFLALVIVGIFFQARFLPPAAIKRKEERND